MSFNSDALEPPGLEECNEICYKDPVLKDQQWSAYIDRSPGAAGYSEVFYLFNEFLFLFHLCLSLFLQWNFLLILIIIQLIKWNLYVKILLGIILDLFCPDLFNSFIFLYFLCLVIKIFGPPLLYTGMLSCLCVWLWLQGEFVLMVKLFVASCPFFPLEVKVLYDKALARFLSWWWSCGLLVIDGNEPFWWNYYLKISVSLLSRKLFDKHLCDFFFLFCPWFRRCGFQL